MPIYEYQCTKCNDRTEVIQKFSDPPYAICSKCGGDVKKLMSAPAIQFKGSGFYKNDSRTSSTPDGEKKGEKKSDAPAKTETAAKSDATPAKSESTPASTTSTPASKTA